MSAPLPLDDPRWGELEHAYGPAADVPDMLRRFAEDPTDLELWGDLCGSVTHQGSVYTASYATAAHLVAIAESVPVEKRTLCWIFVGTVAGSLDPVPVPAYLRDAYEEALRRAATAIPETLAVEQDENGLWCLLAAAAAVAGKPQVAYDIESCHSGEHAPACRWCDEEIAIEPRNLRGGIYTAMRCTACGELSTLWEVLVARAADEPE